MAVKRAIRVLFILSGIFLSAYVLFVPYGSIWCLRTSNPQTTALIEIRKAQALKKGKNLEVQLIWKRTSEISPNLIHALLLAEDDTFYQHHGFDFDQIRIAIQMDWRKKRFAYGGSTLTQQLARTLYLSPSKNLLRKLKEAWITFLLEKVLTKKRILELYVNVAEWGEGIYGAEAASLHYYDKSSSNLSVEESVALVSILPSPKKWSPFRETKFMLRRRGNLIERMISDGYIPAFEETGSTEAETREYSEFITTPSAPAPVESSPSLKNP